MHIDSGRNWLTKAESDKRWEEIKAEELNKKINPVENLIKYKKALDDKGLYLLDIQLNNVINGIIECIEYLDKRKGD